MEPRLHDESKRQAIDAGWRGAVMVAVMQVSRNLFFGGGQGVGVASQDGGALA